MDQQQGSPPDAPPGFVVLQMLVGRWASQAISAAAELGIADALNGAALTPDEIGARIGAHGPSVRRLMRALASVGIFAEDERGRFHQTPLSEALRDDVPGSIRGMARHVGAHATTAAWADLAESVRRGEPAFRRVHGKSFFEHLADAPAEAAAFDHAMHGVSSTEIPAVLAAYDFSDAGTLVDVGGGDGTLARAILAEHPHLRGVVADLPHVVARARERLATLPEGARVATAAGSFFESVPAGGDTYLLKHILHDWDDARCVQILRNVRRVLPARGKLLVIEVVIEPGNDPSFGKLLDLEMIALTEGGAERTRDEFASLLDAAGFRLARVVATAAPASIVEAIPR